MHADLFEKPKRKKPRVMARMIDAGNFPDGRKAVQFACRRCDWVQWMAVKTDTEARRGHPCPNCNQ